MNTRPYVNCSKGSKMIGTYSASGSPSPQTDPDADILLRLAKGERTALNDLMQRHLSAIKSCAWHMLGDEMMAEDIAQEVFLRAWNQAPNWIAGQAKFSTWLHRVTKNLCYDRLRKKTEILTDTLPELMDSGTLADDKMIVTQARLRQKQCVDHALAKLPKRQRMAIVLCHYQELSQNDAAHIMQVGVRAYESLLARGRRNLRAQLAHKKQQLFGK